MTVAIRSPTRSITAASPASGSVTNVYKLLTDTSLDIPPYQRPYKWTLKHVRQLIADIVAHKDKPSYRLGTIVFHREGNKKNIVDGQQRTLTLLLIARAVIAKGKTHLRCSELQAQLDELGGGLIDPAFSSAVTQTNLQNNYLEIARSAARGDFNDELVRFLLYRCEVITFCLDDISEAFQFFDSQNARGRDLEPHDLLKAYHLRAFGKEDAAKKAATVAPWEDSDNEALANLFANYWYRIRNWSRGVSARRFSKDDTALFKGVNFDPATDYPYAAQLCALHHHIDHCPPQTADGSAGPARRFPFQLDQIIINGRRFFEMTDYYQGEVARLAKAAKPLHEDLGLDGHALMIMGVINSYEGRHRTGDRYVRNLFDCLLIYYIDKFGSAELSRAVERIFIWAFRLRLEQKAVHLASVDNHVLQNNLFKVIAHAIQPGDFLNHSLRPIEEVKFSKAAAIEALFKDMYCV